MLCQIILTLSLLILIAVPVKADDLYKLPDLRLGSAATAIRGKDYKAARNHVIQAAPSVERNFLLGIISMRLNNWQEAEQNLAIAADSFQLLADYSLYYLAEAMNKQGKNKFAQAPLKKLLKYYPDSPLQRPGSLLLAETYYETKEYKSALEAYQQFIERYPSGNDSLRAAYSMALCHNQLGERNLYVAELKKIWLRYPASDYALKTEKEIFKLTGAASPANLCTAEEMYRRGTTLYDLRRYNQSIKTFLAVPQEGQSEYFIGRLLLKTGQALTKAKRYKEAEQIFSRLLQRHSTRETKDEALFWLAKVQDKLDKDDEAYSSYLKIADQSPDSPLAENALLDAARIKKYQGKPAEMVPVLKRILQSYARSHLRQQTMWELGWASFLSGDHATAAEYFKILLDNDLYREKALYWYARALTNRGDLKGSQTAVTTLLSNYPLGYYAYMARKNLIQDEYNATPVSFSSTVATLPLPRGLERAKALIAFGLLDDAKIELLNNKKNVSLRQKNLIGIARLYLEMDDYAAAIIHIKPDLPKRFDKDTIALWAISYPAPFTDIISKYSTQNGVAEELVYSLIRAESNFARTALSPAGAIGLMQLMPATAATISKGIHGKSLANQLTNPEFNIRVGVRHLKDLLKVYDGDLVATIAAYNAGTTNVNRWRRIYSNRKTDEFIESIPFDETRDYVKKVLAGTEIYRRLYRIDSRKHIRHAPLIYPDENFKTAFQLR